MQLAQNISYLDAEFHNWAAALGFPVEAMLRLLLATCVGGLIGLEREIRGRQAGFRTYLLVCVGSALVMIVSIRFASIEWAHSPSVNLNIDPARIAYGVMTGVGFLGAGTIIHQGTTVRGLTTAAGLWCVAALGLAAGFGMYVVTFAACLLILTTLWLLDYVEEIIPKRQFHTLTVRTKWTPGCVEETMEWFKKALKGKPKLLGFRREKTTEFVEIRLMTSVSSKAEIHTIIQKLESNGALDLTESGEI